MNISEPFNFHHVTHTQPHHAQKLERANPNDLVSEFSALRASQASQPELRGIKAKDIQREDLPRDALLPDCPSQLRSYPAGLPPFPSYRTQDHALDSPYGATSPVRDFSHPRFTDNFSQPSAAYHTAQTSPTSPVSQTSSCHLTPDFFTFHTDYLSDTIFEPPMPTESPEPFDYSTGSWNDGAYDLASPHAVTTDDGADWNRQVPFSMVKTELAPVEEDDETEEKRNSVLASSTYHPMTPSSGFRKKWGSSAATLRWGSDGCLQVAANPKGRSWYSKPPAEESPRSLSNRPLCTEEDTYDSLHNDWVLPAKISEPSIEDPLDDIPVQPRFSRCISVGPDDMEGFWDMASDAISCSYALGAEGDSNFDWHRSSIHEDDATAPTADEVQTNAADMPFQPPNQKTEPDSPSRSSIAAKRSSSVYSRSPSPLLPTSPSALDPPSASSIESSFSSIPEAVTPIETTESAIATRFSNANSKEWCQPAYVVSHDLDSQTAQEELYHQMYTIDYSHEAPFQIHNVGRVDGSTISNSPRSSRSPISKSSSQESFWYTQAALNARRPRNAGSIGSLPELMSSKNSRERFDSALDQSTDNLTCLNPSDSPPDGQHTSAAQRRRSPNLAKDAAQNIILSRARTAEEPLPLLPVSRERAVSDVTYPNQDSPMPLPLQPGRRTRSGSNASNISARGSRGSYSPMPPPHLTPTRSP